MRSHRAFIRFALFGAVSLLFLSSLRAEESKTNEFKSKHFRVITDLPAKDAKEHLKRLEMMIDLVSDYWGHKPVGIVDCYIIDDLDNWPVKKFPLTADQDECVRRGDGVTSWQKFASRKSGKTVGCEATVWASSREGVVQHEAVHAYCRRAYGEIGPRWYGEGMAEIGNYWRKGDLGVTCAPKTLKNLKTKKVPSADEIIHSPNTYPADSVQYDHCWALCHVMAFSPAYKKRFLALGVNYLTLGPQTFDQAFGSMKHEIDFEFRFFLTNFDTGYRVDLCSWDWNKKFAPLAPDEEIKVVIRSDRGYQPSGLKCVPGVDYAYTCEGEWVLRENGPSLTADGYKISKDQLGKLSCAILNQENGRYELSKSHVLGAKGTFGVKAGGDLYLRCRDWWNKIADNKGEITVTIKLAPKKKPSEPSSEPAPADEPTVDEPSGDEPTNNEPATGSDSL